MEQKELLQNGYTALGQLRALESHIAGFQLDGVVSPEVTGQSTFKHWSTLLWNQVCGEHTELQKLAEEAGLTVDKLKGLFSAVLIGMGVAGGVAGIVAAIAVTLFFDVAAPKICAKWKEWNGSDAPNFYQQNSALPSASLQELSRGIPNTGGG